MAINIQFVRLDTDVCETLNDLAGKQRRTVSELVNQIIREYLAHPDRDFAAGEAAAE